LQQHFIYRYGTHTAHEPASLFWCDAVMRLQFTHVHTRTFARKFLIGALLLGGVA